MDLDRGKHEIPSVVDLASEDTEAWHEAFARMNNLDATRRATHENILRAILPDKCYASVSVDGLHHWLRTGRICKRATWGYSMLS